MTRTTGTKAKTTARKPAGRKKSPAKAAELELRKATIETAAEAVDQNAPDFHEFLARWGTRYSVSNLVRLWVQCPQAVPSLHKYGTWQAMGRQVKAGEKAILLVQPRTHTDPDKATPENPDGKVIHGAQWVALFDISQTEEIGEFTEVLPEGVTPAMVTEVARLRAEAIELHPDHGGEQAKFVTAWAAYEAARALVKG
jgi:hypothetical protein